MSDRDLVPFLLRAKRATYAGNGPEAASSRPGSHDLSYQEGDLLYLDSYLGGSRFAGEEALWVQNVPVWSMNYARRVTGPGFSGDFLKEALRHVGPDMPYRGPARHVSGDFVYTCEVTGDFSWFQGRERITRQGAPIYECHFHGGLIE